MSILQFLRTIWAGRFIVMVTTLVCALAGLVLVLVVPPKYVGESRVMLEVIKPDPVTGQVMATAFLRAYTKTQIELLQGEAVARAVVDDLGWANDKDLTQQYRDRAKGDDRDFSRWAAQMVIDGTAADVIDGSNILDITYKSRDPDTARKVADSLAKAYIATTLQYRQDAARRNADWYDVQAEKAKAALFQAESVKSSFERQNGVMLQDDKIDIDSARLQALASVGGGPQIVTTGPAQASPTEMQLSQIDGEIAQASKTLGPNNPTLIDMRRKRDVLASAVAQEKASQGSTPANSARQAAVLLDEQKAKVLGQRDKIEQLRLLQDNVDLRRDEYNKAATRAAQLRQEATVADSGVTPLGSATTPQAPVFPNKPLILAGGLIGGLGLGLLTAIGKELIGRRVRGPEDLRATIDVPILAIISNLDRRAEKKGRKVWFSRRGQKSGRITPAPA